MQADAPVPLYCPAGQMEAVAEVEPEGQMYPALQSPLHAAVLRLVVAPYLPGAHSIHRPQHTDTSAHERTLWVSRGKPPWGREGGWQSHLPDTGCKLRRCPG